MQQQLSRRLRRLPRARVLGREVPVAVDRVSRLLGLAWLARDAAGCGLLIPCCASVHTFGMRFALDLHFLDAEGVVLATRRRVGARRVASCRGAAAVLEIPSEEGGDFSSALT